MTTKNPRRPILSIWWSWRHDEDSGKVDEVSLLKDVLGIYEVATIRRMAINGSSNEVKYIAGRVLTMMGH